MDLRLLQTTVTPPHPPTDRQTVWDGQSSAVEDTTRVTATVARRHAPRMWSLTLNEFDFCTLLFAFLFLRMSTGVELGVGRSRKSSTWRTTRHGTAGETTRTCSERQKAHERKQTARQPTLRERRLSHKQKQWTKRNVYELCYHPQPWSFNGHVNWIFLKTSRQTNRNIICLAEHLNIAKCAISVLLHVTVTVSAENGAVIRRCKQQ